MNDSEPLALSLNGKIIAKNVIYNISGYGIPLLFALIIIPFLIDGLGDERFGILNLALVIIGYFSLFDFGLGKTLTKIIAEKIGSSQTAEVPRIFWTSLYLMIGISIFGTITLSFLTPFLVNSFFNISETLRGETISSFYLLALSLPIVIANAGFRGVLEAYQKFNIINSIRIVLGILTFLVPLICLIFTKNLFWIIFFLTVVRLIVWVVYIVQCFKLDLNLKKDFRFDSKLVKSILKLGGWMTVSNVIGPLITYLDRFLIGSLISATAITFYVTPYEVVTKLLLIPAAIMGVLFPVFSANYLNNPEFNKKLVLRGTKYIFILLFPLSLLIITFSYQGMELWLGRKFADTSFLILRFLAAGVFFNSLAYIPFTFLQGIGKPDITAKVHLIELPLYLIAILIAINEAGINGVAFVWFIRMLIDFIVLFQLTKKIIPSRFELNFRSNYLFIMLISALSFLLIFMHDINLKIFFTLIFIVTFSLFTWKNILVDEEKTFLRHRLKILNLFDYGKD
jgi:O-antigen/teichoic acid export membrane protein